MSRRRRRYGGSDPDLPAAKELAGPVVGAKILGARYREEGCIALGHDSERWRLTDDINALLEDDSQFIAGDSLQDIKNILEIRFPSPVPGVSMIEICSKHDLKRHNMPFGDAVIKAVRKNPHYNDYRYGDKYIVSWLPDPIGILTGFSMTNDLLITKETEEHLREDDDFYSSDLVIGRRDNWYSIVKYRPTKAAARRKTKVTIKKNDDHATALLVAGRDLRVAAGQAHNSLRDELDSLGVNLVISRADSPKHGYYHSTTYDEGSTSNVRDLRAMLVVHAALRGKHAYRYNAEWLNFLQLIKIRPKDLDDDKWGNYQDVKPWLEVECKRKLLKPTKIMTDAKEAAAAAELKSRTCASCGAVKDYTYELFTPPGEQVPTLCENCWEAKFEVPDEQLSADSLSA
jgi:hypothetical protein